MEEMMRRTNVSAREERTETECGGSKERADRKSEIQADRAQCWE